MFLVVIKNMEHGYNLQNNSSETFKLYPVSYKIPFVPFDLLCEVNTLKGIGQIVDDSSVLFPFA